MASKEHEEEYKKGYQDSEKHYQAQVAALQAENARLERSKSAAKYIIKKQAAQILLLTGG